MSGDAARCCAGVAAGSDRTEHELRQKAGGSLTCESSGHSAEPKQLPPPIQAYPGQLLPRVDRQRYPIPDRPGEYCDREEFMGLPKFLAQLAHWPDRLEAVLDGRYEDLMPAHFEGIFTLVCNFKCPHCTRRVTRKRWVEGGTWSNNTEVSTDNTMSLDNLCRTIDQVASLMTDQQMGIVWGGGDPTANPATYDAMHYAKKLGLSASFLTNGVFLEVDRCLDAEPVLVRISLNCGTEEAYRRFHGYPKGWDYFDRARSTMRKLARRKIERQSNTLVGVSLIMDERNLQDIEVAAREVQAVVDHAGGGVDYCIVRPTMNYGHFEHDWAVHKEDTKRRAAELLAPGGEVARIFRDCGVALVSIKDSFSEPPSATEDFYDDSDCLAYGVCSEIRHNGDVQLCSDSYGNPKLTIGNLLQDDLADIWRGERRHAVLTQVNRERCYRTYCPHNSRGHHFNRLFHRIERKRREGKIAEVRRWAADLREVTYPLGHSFFI